MRKVYSAEKSSVSLMTAVIFSVGLTGCLFGIIPFAHQIVRPERSLELRKTTAIEQPPEAEEQAPPPQVEEAKPPEAPPEPQLADAPQQISFSADLEVATGTGGALEGFGVVKATAAAETVGKDIFDIGELEKRPEPVSQVPPTYPAALRKAKVEGMVTLIFILGEDGRVEDPRVENSSRTEFEKPALEAIRKWRFRPGMKDGQAVRSYVRIPMRFRVSSG